MMPSAESGGESFARLAKRSIESVSVMGSSLRDETEAAESLVVVVGGTVTVSPELAVVGCFNCFFKDFLTICSYIPIS